MKKKFFILSSLIFAFLFFTSTMAFEADNTMNAIGEGARNVVNGAENLVTKGVDATKNTVNDVSKGIGDTMNSEKNATRNNSNNYITQRTATRTTANNGMFTGMNAMTWSWIIMGILGIAIVALVWAYGMQYDKEHKEEHSNINE